MPGIIDSPELQEIMRTSDPVEMLQQVIMHKGEAAFKLIPGALLNVLEKGTWRKRKDAKGHEFTSFEQFATHRLWQGLETSMDDLRMYCRNDPDALKALDEALDPPREGPGRPTDKEQSLNRDNITIRNKRGTSATYLLRRLKSERPDLFARTSKTLPKDQRLSVHAAAVEAGFVKKKKLTPFEQVLRVLPSLTAEERGAVYKELRRLAALTGVK